VLDVEVIGASDLPADTVRRLSALALASAAVHEGHLAVEFVAAERIAALNEAHRGVTGPTDVLSFPVDLDEAIGLPATERELGDVVICPEFTVDEAEAVVHGVLHLVGMDHEADEGEMLALQAQILSWAA